MATKPRTPVTLDLRQEPGAGKPHAGICAGGGEQSPSLPRPCAAGNDGHEAYTAIVWGVGLSHERNNNAGAETVSEVEGNMSGTAMRGADALPGSNATSRPEGSRWNLGDPAFDYGGATALARIGKARSRSR
jgi:hypothetical protein